MTNDNCANALDRKNPIWRDEHGKRIVRDSDDGDSDDSNEDDEHIEKRKVSAETDDDDDVVITNVTNVNDPVAYEDLRDSNTVAAAAAATAAAQQHDNDAFMIP